ncbi:MAG: peptidase [Mycobacteriales bacterium]
MSRRRLGLPLAAALVTAAMSATALASTAPATTPRTAATPRPGPAAPTLIAGTTSANPASTRFGVVPGLPGGVPAAAQRPQPALPTPAGWPFPEAFPRTSGTGRLAGGATYWTDFLYDDHGAAGVEVATPISSLAPTAGTYVYPTGPADNNGADIFRAAVGLTSQATYWRVDWVTLADARVPIAEWTIDSDRNTASGVSAWPANAGVRSPGIDTALVVSSQGAQLIDLLTGAVTHLPTNVDMAARSFVVRIPRSVLPVPQSSTWRVRLASGLANPAGTAFATVPTADGAAPGQPNVYNVTFRSVAQEPPQFAHGTVPGYVGSGNAASLANLGNYWMENDQAATLATGDVSKFFLDVHWAQLAAKVTTPEPLVYGYSARWYTSPINLGQGVIPNASNSPSEDLRPNYLSRVQPYAVYVPDSYRPGTAAPLTWVLHSLDVNYNQYGALDPRQLQAECENRQSICASPEGFGPDGWYFDEAEADFWAVWRQLGLSYTLDPNRTVLSGYSMGGFATYKLGFAYPDLFASAIALAGPPMCGLRVYGQVEGAAGPGRCTTDGSTTPLVANARWLPYSLADGCADELVPISSVLEQEQAILATGDRLHAEIYPAEDHLFYATQDAFESAIAAIGMPVRVRNPGIIDYTWYPHLTRADLGIGPTGVYWIRGLAARLDSPGSLASLQATDAAIPAPAITPQQSASADPTADPSPALVINQTWALGPAPATARVLTLHLSGVAALAIDTLRARLPHGIAHVTTDGPVTITLLGVGKVVHLGAGTSTITW